MIRKAVEYYGEVYFCTADRSEFGSDYHSMYLTPYGKLLMQSCLRKGIIKKEWAKNPLQPE